MKRILNINRKSKNELSSTEVVVGYGENNEPIIVNFSECNHLVITGRAGSGKSRALSSIINDLVAKNSVEDLEIYAMQSLNADVEKFRELEHCKECISPMVVEDRFLLLENITGCVEHLERKAKRRNSLLKDLSVEFGIKDISIIAKELPLVILVIDEFSSLTHSVLNYDEGQLRAACLEALEEIIKISKGLNICVIQAGTRLEDLSKNDEVENVTTTTIKFN